MEETTPDPSTYLSSEAVLSEETSSQMEQKKMQERIMDDPDNLVTTKQEAEEQAAAEKEKAAAEKAERERYSEIFKDDPRAQLDVGQDKSNWTESEFSKEIGAGIVGGTIDAVEGIGSTAEMLLTGQALNNEFRPTWLQMDDKYEPANNTLYGKMLREATSFLVPFGAVGLLGKVGKVKQAVQFVEKGGKALKVGKYIPGVFKSGAAKQSAVATFLSSSSEGETLNDLTKDHIKFWTLTTTSPETSPIEKKLKHVLEDMALGGIVDKLFSFRAGKAVAEGIDNGTIKPKNLTPKQAEDPKQLELYLNTDPEAVAAKVSSEITESQRNALNEQIQLDLFDHGLTKPTPATHPQFYSQAERGLRGTRVGNLYNHMKDMLAMAARGDYAAGRRARLATDAAIKRMARGSSEVKKQVEAFAEELQKGMERPGGVNVGGMKTTLDGVRQLAIARYTDIMTAFPDLAKADFDDIQKALLEDAIEVPAVGGGKTQVMNSANAMALEMLMYDLGAAVSDKAMALHSLSGQVPIKEGIANLLTKVETAFMMHQEASEFAGSLLRARRGDVFTQKVSQGLANVTKQERLKTFTSELGKLMESDPELSETFLRVFAETNGEVHTLEALRRYASDTVFNWKSVLGVQGARSKFVEGLFNTLYNSILSAPKTLSRAFSGTGLLTVMRPIQIAMGGALSGDQKMMAKGLHMAFDNMYGSISEAWQLAASTHYSLVHNRVGPYVNQLVSPTEKAHWTNLGKIIEQSGNPGELAMYRFTSTMLDFNNQSWVRYPSNFMTTIDAFSKTLIGRQELKARAFEAAWNEGNGKVTRELLQKYETKLKDSIFNKQGEVVDIAAARAGQEVALQIPLSGKLGLIDSLLQTTPILRPFFLFMKTGANAISVVSKHTPILGRFNDDVRAILSATPDNLDGVAKFGINSPAQLAEARALVKGRIATGYMTVGSAIGLYTTGRLTGNGPANRELRNAWIRSGKWRPRSIKLGNKWINYDGLEPFASFLALVADIGDNANTLGEAGTEDMLRKAGYLIGMNLTNKSFLAGLQPLTDVLAFDGARSEVWAANLTNNFIPWSGARNEIANVFNPGLREVERDFLHTLANRNPFFRGQLAVQYDPLNGEIVRDWDFPTRMWNSISPIQITGNDNPTRKLLRESGYDMSETFKVDSYGNRLNPEQRSKMMELMGKEGIEDQLTELFNDPNIKKEMEYYRKLRDKQIPGKQLDNPENLRIEDALFFQQISGIFNRAKRNAEVELFQIYPELVDVGTNTQIKRNMQRGGLIDEVDDLFYSTRNR